MAAVLARLEQARQLPRLGRGEAPQPAAVWQEREGAYLPLTLDVMRITGGEITEVVIFDADQFPRLGVPERLAADGTE